MQPASDRPAVRRGPGAGSGLAWSLLNSVVNRLATVVIGIVMARLLVPADFGGFAVALAVLAVAQSANDAGVGLALVRSADPTPGVTGTATTVALAGSLLVYALVLVVAGPVATASGDPGAASLIAVLGLAVVLDGVTTVPNAVLAREFRQRQRAVADVVALVPAAALGIGLAAGGAGAWGLVVSTLSANLTAGVLVVRCCPGVLRPGWDRRAARRLLGVGAPLAAASLVLVATLNVDTLVVGREVGAAALGAYLLAFNLSSWPTNLVSVAVRRVTIPAFARSAVDGSPPVAVFARALHGVAAFAGVATVCLAVLAEPLVELLYGPRWSATASALRWLAVLGGLRVVLDLGYDVLAALGRTRSLLAVQVVWFGSLLVALPLGARWRGIEGVALAHCAVAAVVVMPFHVVCWHRAGLRVGSIGRAVALPLVATPVAVAVAAAVRSGLPPVAARFGGAVPVVVVGATVSAVFAATLALDRDDRHLVRHLTTSLVRRPWRQRPADALT